MRFANTMRIAAAALRLERLPLIGHWCVYDYHAWSIMGVCNKRGLHRGAKPLIYSLPLSYTIRKPGWWPMAAPPLPEIGSVSDDGTEMFLFEMWLPIGLCYKLADAYAEARRRSKLS